MSILMISFFTIQVNASDIFHEAQSLLQRKCGTCHTGASAKGGVDVSDMTSLVEEGWVSPNSLGDSTLWESISRSEDPMPKSKSPLTNKELGVIMAWIRAGAPTTKKQLPPVRPWSHWFAAAARHLDSHPDEAKDTRFLCVPETLQDAELSQVPDLVHYVFSYLARKSSKGKPLPVAVEGEPRLVAFRLSTYGLKPIDWDAIAFSSMIVPVQPSWNWERNARTPILPLTNFCSTAFYHPVYPVVKRQSMTWQEMLWNMNADKYWAEQQGTRSRWTTLSSGVSRFPRILDRYPSRDGNVTIWESDDFASASKEANPIAHPFSASAIRDGSEMVMFRKDRLPEFYLADNKGNLIHQGPITVVSDARQPSLHVALGKSCAACHNTGTVPVDDHLRPAVERFSFAYSSYQVERTLRLHRPPQESDALVKADAHQFLTLIKELQVKPESALLLQRLVEEQADLATMDRLSRILGVQPSAIENALDSNAELARHLGTIVTGPGISWEVVEDKLPQLLWQLGLPVAKLQNPMMERGWQMQRKYRYEQAHLSFQWASLLDPDNAAAFAAANRSKPLGIIARCERILEENPRDRVTRFVLAKALRSIGEFDLAADQERYATTN